MSLRPPIGPLGLGALVVAALTVRVGIYLTLQWAGYFYGKPWDTFTRANLGWQWAQRPYFAAGDVYWPPLQFWLVGVGFFLSRPLTGNESNLLVPVAVNNLLFAGSLWVTCLAAGRLAGRLGFEPLLGATVAAVLAVSFGPDIWLGYSALAEPIYILLTLLSSYLFLERLRSPSLPVELGLVGMLAAAAHYLGWFLAAFCAGFVLVRWWLEGGFKGRLLVGLVLCGLFPALWLVENWRHWGEPLHFLRLAAAYQAPYAGSLDPAGRLLLLANGLAAGVGILGLVGLVGAAAVAVRCPEAVRYLLPGCWLMATLLLTTALGLSNPGQEPRYLVIFGWVLIPLLGAWISGLLMGRGIGRRTLALILLLALAGNGLHQAFQFENSFGPDVAELAGRVRDWLRSNRSARVVVEVELAEPLASFAERVVVPVVAGYPDRFDFVVATRNTSVPPEGTADLVEAVGRGDLAITRNPATVRLAAGYGIFIEQIGGYFVLRPPGDRR